MGGRQSHRRRSLTFRLEWILMSVRENGKSSRNDSLGRAALDARFWNCRECNICKRGHGVDFLNRTHTNAFCIHQSCIHLPFYAVCAVVLLIKRSHILAGTMQLCNNKESEQYCSHYTLKKYFLLQHLVIKWYWVFVNCKDSKILVCLLTIKISNFPCYRFYCKLLLKN
jgi:hypothetical protein